jgi:hypothetical protein
LKPKVVGSRFRVQACPGLRLVAYASESATGCGYDIVFAFSGIVLPSPHLAMPDLGQEFKGYNCLKLVTYLIHIDYEILKDDRYFRDN